MFLKWLIMSIVNRNYIFSLFIFFILIIFAAFRPIGLDSDSYGYVGWIEYDIYKSRSEITFIWIVDFWKQFISDQDILYRMLFVTYAVIQMIILKKALNNYTKETSKALILYFFLLYSILTLTQIRVGVASVIFFWAIYDIIHKNKFAYFFKILLAISFHKLAIVFIPFYFINTKKINKLLYFLIIPFGMISLQFLNNFKPFVDNIVVMYFPPFISKKVHSYLLMEGQAVSTYNSWFLFILLIYLIVLINLKKFDKNHITYIKVLGIGILLYFLTNFISILSFRISNTIGLLTLFLTLNIARVFKQSKTILIVFFLIAFLIFINTHFRNQLLNIDILFGDFIFVNKKG